jgi:hypothetical protein
MREISRAEVLSSTFFFRGRFNCTTRQKAKIFHWLCRRYHDPGKGNEYIDKNIVRHAINIAEEVFEKALNEFVDSEA